MPDLSPVAERELAAVDDALAGRRVDPDLTGLAELALLLRDERPAPTSAFTNQLDRSVRVGFPAGGSRARARPGAAGSAGTGGWAPRSASPPRWSCSWRS